MPLTASDAEYDGWTQYDSSCGEYGIRYYQNNDPTILLMFGANGNLIGLQNTVQDTPSQNITPPWSYQYDLGLYALSFLFVNATSYDICDAYYPSPNGSLGEGLWLQDGDEWVLMPMTEEDAQAQGWVAGKCFASMGKHYWYGISTDMNCDNFFPVGVMYTDDSLVTWLTNIIGDETSSYWEHPPTATFDLFFYSDSYPNCLRSLPNGVSTIHYFVTNPIWNTCL